MFINKINSFSEKTFKGYEHEINNVGKQVLRFNIPYNFNQSNSEAYVEIYRVKENDKAEYQVLKDKCIYRAPLNKNEGVSVDIDGIEDLDRGETFAYRFLINNKHVTDSGFNSDGYNIIVRRGTTPIVQGAGALTMPKVHRPGASYRKDGSIDYNSEKQKDAENSTNHFASTPGGSLAGVQYDLYELKRQGIKKLFTNPILGADSVSHHGYWNQNNMQIAPDVATVENYHSYIKSTFQNGMNYVNDGTFTSEGLQGVHFQYALRWAQKNPQTYYWFKMSGLKNAPLGLGVIPRHKENYRHKVINPPVIYNQTTGKVEENKNYDSTQDTLFQIYDASLVRAEDEIRLDKAIQTYKKLRVGDALNINTHDDTVANYIFAVSPEEYKRSLIRFAEYNKDCDKKIELNSPEGTILVARFSNFELKDKTDGGFSAWDANTDMAKMNFGISLYDEKINQAIVDFEEKDLEQTKQRIGSYEVQDLAIQAGVYWTQKSKDTQTLYTAKVLKNTKESSSIDKLILNELLPVEAQLSEEEVKNILNDSYNNRPYGILSRDELTIKSLMKLPLDSLELGVDTVGVLSTSYFSNRATEKEFLGLDRYTLMQNDNPHLLKEYNETYIKAENWFKTPIKDFADRVINKINDLSEEKLIDSNGEYTEYGEYIIDILGPMITKYALLKAIAGRQLDPYLLPNGELTYNYDEIRNYTGLASLGVFGANPKDEAKQLEKLISNGLNKLDDTDISLVALSLSKQIKGTNTNSFKLADAIVNKAGLGLDWRLDAAKDIIDMDAVRNGDLTFDKAWDKVIEFWAKFVEAIKSVNPNSYIVAEITDIESLMKSIQGENTDVNKASNPDIGIKYKTVEDALRAFFDKTGVTSEAGYSYTFTDLLKTFSAEFESGSMILPGYEDGKLVDNRPANFIWKLYDLIEKRGLNFTRNLFTFADNHDKPSVLHGMALDMGLFFSDYDIFESTNLNVDKNRWARMEAMRILTNSNSYEEMPLEAQLSIDNVDYYKTVSPRAVAMSKLFRDIINEDLDGIATKEEISLLNRAVKDLTNGNYLGIGTNVNMSSIKIPELQTLENALRTISEFGNFQLSENDFNAIIDAAKDKERMLRYTAYGDFNWSGGGNSVGEMNRERARRFLPEENDYMQYSTYTVAIAALLEEAFRIVKGDIDYGAFKNGGKNFIKKFDKNTIEAKRNPLPFYEDSHFAARKNNYAAMDFETVIKMIIEQANFIAKNSEQEGIINTDDILVKLFRSSTEPAVQKAVMYATYLSAFPGLPTVYLRNVLGALGFDDKTKNISLKNRNVIPWTQKEEENPLQEYRNKIYNMFMDAINIRNRDGVRALNSGTPYKMEAFINNGQYEQKDHTSLEKIIPAYLMQDAYGNMTISVFNSLGINPHNRAIYDSNLYNQEGNYPETINPENKYVPVQSKYELDYIALAKGLELPEELEFVNSDIRDKAIYVVRKIGERFAIFNKNGGRLSLNGITAKNGVMILKHVAKTSAKEKLRSILAEAYKKADIPTLGKKLSIIAK